MNYEGKRVFVIPNQMVGVARIQDSEEVLVEFSRDNGYWFLIENVRLWTRERSKKCGFDRKCWSELPY